MINSRFLRNVALGVRTLMRHKLRSLLTMLGVVFGVGSVIAMLAVGEGASQEALAEIRKLGSNNIMVDAVKPIQDAESRGGQTYMSVYGLEYADADRASLSLPTVLRTVPVKAIRKEASFGRRTVEMRLVGTTPDWFSLVERPVLAGRILQAVDEADQRNVVVLTESGARRLLATASSIGSNVRIGSTAFQVIGIVQSAHDADGRMRTPDQDADAYVPLSAARSRFGDVFMEGKVGSYTYERVELHHLILAVDRLENVEPTAQALETMLKRFHRTLDYRIDVPLALLRQAEATQRTFNIVLGSIGGISLLVGGIGIMNIMLASVTERTREIGIRRAIGAKRRQIAAQFLIEAIVLSTAGGVLGLAIGLLIPWLISQVAGLPTVVTWTSLVLSLGISLATGIIFGLYPALRAARMDPITALRHE